MLRCDRTTRRRRTFTSGTISTRAIAAGRPPSPSSAGSSPSTSADSDPARGHGLPTVGRQSDPQAPEKLAECASPTGPRRRVRHVMHHASQLNVWDGDGATHLPCNQGPSRTFPGFARSPQIPDKPDRITNLRAPPLPPVLVRHLRKGSWMVGQRIERRRLDTPISGARNIAARRWRSRRLHTRLRLRVGSRRYMTYQRQHR